MMDILRRPLITEKVAARNEQGVYGFIVDNSINKLEIKKAVEQVYNVVVVCVNTMRYAGKRKIRHTKLGVSQGKRPAYKKALVTLKEGEVIDFYSSIN